MSEAQLRQRIRADRRHITHEANWRQAMRRRVRHSLHTSGVNRRRLDHDIKALRRFLDAHAPSGQAGALKWALSHVGVHEEPPFSNDGPFLRQEFTVHGWQPGYAWCQYMADAILRRGGGPTIDDGYTPDFLGYAKRGEHGLRLVTYAQLQPGDWVYFKWPGVSGDVCDHVGTYLGNGKTLEGNTSPGTTGSQNNGGGLYIRERGTADVAFCVRPTYGKVT